MFWVWQNQMLLTQLPNRRSQDSLTRSSTPVCGIRDIKTKNSLPCSHYVLVHHAAFHHKAYIFKYAHILQRVGGDGDDVSVLPCLDGAYIFCATNQVCSAGCGGVDSLCRSQPELDHIEELFGVVAVRINSRIGAEGRF